MHPDPAPWMVPLDIDILEFYDEHPIRISPSILAANIDYARQYVSQRCQALTDAGLLFHDEDNLYVITPFGTDYLDGDIDPQSLDAGPPNHYTGITSDDDTYTVLADGVELTRRLNFHTRDINYSWGYIGNGPTALAIALISDVCDTQSAEEHATAFTREVISSLPENWELSAADIQAFITDQ